MNEPIPLAIRADLPCPFCGGRAELHKQLRGGHEPDETEAYAYFYICDSCACAGGWGKSEAAALRMWSMRGNVADWRFCRGEGCPRADLCRRHMDAVRVKDPTYFKKAPLLVDGQCGEFVSNGCIRKDPNRCGGAHPPPCCAWQCEIELHRWEKRGEEWMWIDGGVH